MRTRWLLGLGILLVVASACAPRPSVSGGDPCLVGDYRLSAQEVLRSLHTPVGAVTLSGGVGGRTLSIRADGTTSLSSAGIDPIALTAANLSGSVLATATASGTWTTVPGGRVELTVTALSGTATFDGTVDGTVRHVVLDLGASGLSPAVAPTGTASYACGDPLTLRNETAVWTWSRV